MSTEQNTENIIYIVWKTEIIEADHGGYCSSADNEEEIYEDQIICKYILDKKEYEIFIWICNECTILFSENIFIDIMKPIIPIENLPISGSGYCSPSKHGLSHEKQTTIIEIINCNYTPILSETAKISKCDSFSLKQYLKPIIEINDTVLSILKNKIPLDTINEICKYVWSTYKQ
jgi:hypothetical protein